MEWPASINWNTPSGKVLRHLCTKIPEEKSASILVFGSAALQLTVTENLLSRDVDIAVEEINIAANKRSIRRQELQRIVQQEGLSEGKGIIFVQVCSPTAFETSPIWGRRAMTSGVGHVSITIPHPYDILIAKVHRLAPKDIEAFKQVIKATGHPTAEEFKLQLQQCPRLFDARIDDPLFPAQHGRHLFKHNVSKLWPIIFNRTISVTRDIIRPTLESQALDYGTPKGLGLHKKLVDIKESSGSLADAKKLIQEGKDHLAREKHGKSISP